jgi:hypothetical protein
MVKMLGIDLGDIQGVVYTTMVSAIKSKVPPLKCVVKSMLSAPCVLDSHDILEVKVGRSHARKTNPLKVALIEELLSVIVAPRSPRSLVDFVLISENVHGILQGDTITLNHLGSNGSKSSAKRSNRCALRLHHDTTRLGNLQRSDVQKTHSNLNDLSTP